MTGAIRCLSWLLPLLCADTAMAAAIERPAYQSAGRSMTSAPSIYAERCGGCHGLQGRSAAKAVPDLLGRAGYFLCTDASRDFAGRLPNVTFARLSDADLAAVMNYVTRDMQPIVDRIDRPVYSEADMTRLRADPLSITNLHVERRRIVEQMIRRCHAPNALRAYGRPKR